MIPSNNMLFVLKYRLLSLGGKFLLPFYYCFFKNIQEILLITFFFWSGGNLPFLNFYSQQLNCFIWSPFGWGKHAFYTHVVLCVAETKLLIGKNERNPLITAVQFRYNVTVQVIPAPRNVEWREVLVRPSGIG